MAAGSSDIKPVKKLKHHIFVCTNERPPDHPRGCCKQKGAEEILQAFKIEVSKAGIQSEVRAQKSGCLDLCESGATVVIYPDNVWYGGVRVEDVPEIVQTHLVRGIPIDRLRVSGK